MAVFGRPFFIASSTSFHWESRGPTQATATVVKSKRISDVIRTFIKLSSNRRNIAQAQFETIQTMARNETNCPPRKFPGRVEIIRAPKGSGVLFA